MASLKAHLTPEVKKRLKGFTLDDWRSLAMKCADVCKRETGDGQFYGWTSTITTELDAIHVVDVACFFAAIRDFDLDIEHMTKVIEAKGVNNIQTGE